VTDAMQTSLARRQRRRRSGSGRRPSNGRRAVAGVAIAIPLFLFASLLVTGLLGAAGVVSAFSYYSQGLPEPTEVFGNLKFAEVTSVYDRANKVQLATFARERRDVVAFDEISPLVVDATTSIEDKTFWENAGFDPAGIVSAGLDTISGNARGASTITQQLVRNRLLPESAFTTTYERKIREIIQSIRLTQAYPGDEGKKQIIAAYLNDNFYGSNNYGIAAASRGYWNVDVSKLSLSQAAILAGIPQSPTAFDLMRNAVEECTKPAGAPVDDACKETRLVVPADTPIVQRRNRILELMKTRSVLTAGQYTTEDYDAAMEEPVVLTPPVNKPMLAPHFVLQVRNQLGGILCGQDAAASCPEVDTGGYRVVTTLDWRLQKMAEKWVAAGARAPNSRDTAAYLKNLGISYRSWIANMKGKGVHNAALAAIDYRTGQVYAYTGSAGFYLKGNRKFQPQFDVLEDGWRQPGSAFKPINYLVGIEDKTLTAATLFMDVVTDFGGGWTPADADRLERGPLRLRQAIQVSLNIPAIKAAIRIGPDRVFERAKDFGIRWNFASNPGGGSIAIGTVEVHMIDLISAYGAIANSGVLMPRTMIREVYNSKGEKIWPLEGAKAKGKRVVSPQAAFIMTDILASNTDPAQNPFWSKRKIMDGGTRRPAALKTGTTDATIDLTAVGFLAPPKDKAAPALVVGTWMGNSDNSAPPRGVVALESAASLWQSFLTQASKGTSIATFKRPKGLVQATVDANSGMKPGSFTRRTVKEWFIEGTVPRKVDNTKNGITVDKATGGLWQEGCAGPKITRGFLDLSDVESEFPAWAKYNRGWITRAARGVGVAGGPARPRTRTTYFYEHFSWTPFGKSWGAPFAPSKKCTIPVATPSPLPSGDPGASGAPPPEATPAP
jgi:membrane peptidoglycan carboxypeptidase